MSRIKGGVIAAKRRKNILAQVKGYRFGRSTKKRQAIEAIHHAGVYAFAHRKDKKGDFRRLWTVRIGAALRAQGTTYSKFIDALNKKQIAINRKMLALLAKDYPATFTKVVEATK